MNLFETLTKTIGILALFNVCLFLIPKPIKKGINILFKGILKLLSITFEYIKDYSYNNLITKKEVSQKSSNVIKFKKKA